GVQDLSGSVRQLPVLAGLGVVTAPVGGQQHALGGGAADPVDGHRLPPRQRQALAAEQFRHVGLGAGLQAEGQGFGVAPVAAYAQ
ncbi:hypothetical protein, partial [Parachitinimonas caeni]